MSAPRPLGSAARRWRRSWWRRYLGGLALLLSAVVITGLCSLIEGPTLGFFVCLLALCAPIGLAASWVGLEIMPAALLSLVIGATAALTFRSVLPRPATALTLAPGDTLAEALAGVSEERLSRPARVVSHRVVPVVSEGAETSPRVWLLDPPRPPAVGPRRALRVDLSQLSVAREAWEDARARHGLPAGPEPQFFSLCEDPEATDAGRVRLAAWILGGPIAAWLVGFPVATRRGWRGARGPGAS